jgi:diaminohydroxyphosphoribosylaminopyrimidine deaminase/5-amino-6-(5-phosphoribosylamino)uracil reductase
MTSAADWMARALKIAERGRYTVSPNPMVGAVIVKDGVCLGEGFHARAGEAHAEIEALKQAGESARGADLYVTLEPCCTLGRTGPCTEAVIEAGISRIVVAVIDPNPDHSGRGLSRLKEAGIDVELGVLQSEATWLNRAFNKWITTQRPWVTLKLAMTLDGRVASATGQSKWITSTKMREHVHRLRAASDAIMVGSGTVLTDDPRLNVRDVTPLFEGGDYRSPLKVIVDSKLSLSREARIFGDGDVLIATSNLAPKEWFDTYREAGAQITVHPSQDDRVDVEALLLELGGRGERPITSVLVEGGATLATDMVKRGLIDECRFHMAPKLMGGDGLSAIHSLGVLRPDDGPKLRVVKLSSYGPDIEIVATLG